MPSRFNAIAAVFIATFASSVAAANTSPQAIQKPADPQFEAAKSFVSFYTFNRLGYKQVCDKQAVDVGVFVTTFVNEHAAPYAKALSVLQAHGISEAAVMAKLQPTIASSEPGVRQALTDMAVGENAGTTTLDGCKFLAAHAEKLAGDLDIRKFHPEILQALSGNKP
jgi:hypothetical protein